MVFKWLSWRSRDKVSLVHGFRPIHATEFCYRYPVEQPRFVNLWLSGLASLFYKHTFLRQFSFGSFGRDFFGIFVGLTFGQTSDWLKYPWPVAQMNAETIASFHGRLAQKTSDLSRGGNREKQLHAHNRKPSGQQSQHKAIKIFAICFAAYCPGISLQMFG